MSQHLRLQISWERYRLPFPYWYKAHLEIELAAPWSDSSPLLSPSPPPLIFANRSSWSLKSTCNVRLFLCMEMWTCVRRMFSWVRRYRSSQTFCFPSFDRVWLVRFPSSLATDIQMIHASRGTQLGFTNTSYSWSAGRPSNSSLPLITTCNRSLISSLFTACLSLLLVTRGTSNATLRIFGCEEVSWKKLPQKRLRM